MEEVLNSQQSLADQGHYLIDEARKAGGPDNITVVLLRRKPEA
jgi:serine/threonine protein phosphatase PrpC